MKQLLIILSFYLAFHPYLGQTQTKNSQQKDINGKIITELHTGDSMPAYTFINVLHFSSRTVDLNAFRSKWVLLDFWDTHCAACIASFSKLEQLQQKFTQKMQVFLVNDYQDEKTIDAFFEKRKQLTKLRVTLPIVFQNAALSKNFFPHEWVPHVVWIDPTGVIRYITGGDVLNEKNIAAVLAGEPTSMAPDTGKLFDIDFSKPLFVDGNGGRGEAILWQSVLSRRVDGFRAAEYIQAGEPYGYHIGSFNGSIRNLYGLAYSHHRSLEGWITMLPISRILLEVKDTSGYVDRVDGEYRWNNHYIYQLTTPPTTEENLQRMMQQDLLRYFGLEVFWEKRTVKCLVFSATDTTLIAYQKGPYKIAVDDTHFIVNNATTTQLIKYLEEVTQYYRSPYPLVDEIGLSGKLGNINVETNVYDISTLDRSLRKYGMRAQLLDREVEMLVLREPSKKLNSNVK